MTTQSTPTDELLRQSDHLRKQLNRLKNPSAKRSLLTAQYIEMLAELQNRPAAMGILRKRAAARAAKKK